MNVIRIFTYAFDDPDWLNKLAITAIITALSVVFTPLLIGLVGWAVLFGYMVALVRNDRLGASAERYMPSTACSGVRKARP